MRFVQGKMFDELDYKDIFVVCMSHCLVYSAAKDWMCCHAWVSVLPSHSENFGGVVVEALAQGTPVIASKDTPWQMLDESGCGWWTEDDDALLSDVLKAALEMTNAARASRSVASKGLARERFSWQSAARILGTIYTAKADVS